MREVGRWQRLLAENTDLLAEGRSGDDVRAAGSEGRTAVILGFQNSSPFEDDLDLVGAFHQAGVRICQLTYNTQNSAGAGCWESDDAGLSRTYGINLVREMNRVGMLIDVSHCNERTSLETLEASERPVAITHANPRAFVGENVELAFRNKSDTVLKKAAESGGVVGLSMYPRIAPNGVGCTVDEFCDMVAYTVDLIGVDHVGLGSDYYMRPGRRGTPLVATGALEPQAHGPHLRTRRIPRMVRRGQWLRHRAGAPAQARVQRERGRADRRRQLAAHVRRRLRGRSPELTAAETTA